jgi:hypothetical protein
LVETYKGRPRSAAVGGVFIFRKGLTSAASAREAIEEWTLEVAVDIESRLFTSHFFVSNYVQRGMIITRIDPWAIAFSDSE